VKRWQLLIGTFAGVLALALLGGVYAAGGLTVILGVKTGVWTVRPLASAVLGGVCFAGLYAPMLVSALFVRSAAFSGFIGGMFFATGIVASYRASLAPLFTAGIGRGLFKSVTTLLPRVATLADTGAAIAGSQQFDSGQLEQLLLGIAVFTVGVLAFGVWRFEQKDF
jgi:Cu-processing system permease protein